MRTLGILLVLVAACGGEEGATTETFAFGPFTLAPGEEVDEECVQISLNNDDYVNINVVELTTGPGFHHSNWFYVPEFSFPGPDGTYRCDDRGFEQAIAAIHGGVFFAQSTQAAHEIQAFPEGVVVRIPPRHKLVSQVHLLNPTDDPLTLAPTIKVTSIPDAQVKTRLAGMSFQNTALGLPPNMQSKFTIECDIEAAHQQVLRRPADFRIYYALAHYHDLGTKLTVDAIKPNGETVSVFTTATKVGDAMGGPLDPLFDFTGFTKIRFSCEYYNPRSSVVGYGVGDQEMCVFLAFTDSSYNFGGGVIDENETPQNPMMVGNTMTFQQDNCEVLANDADRG